MEEEVMNDYDAMLSSAADKLQTDADRVNARKRAKTKAKRNSNPGWYAKKVEELKQFDAMEEIRKKIAAELAEEARRSLRKKWNEILRDRFNK
jgi:hypothetical protein